MNELRKKKGLAIDEKIVEFAEKQRTLTKMKWFFECMLHLSIFCYHLPVEWILIIAPQWREDDWLGILRLLTSRRSCSSWHCHLWDACGIFENSPHLLGARTMWRGEIWNVEEDDTALQHTSAQWWFHLLDTIQRYPSSTNSWLIHCSRKLSWNSNARLW